jgi:hypothetical protein
VLNCLPLQDQFCHKVEALRKSCPLSNQMSSEHVRNVSAASKEMATSKNKKAGVTDKVHNEIIAINFNAKSMFTHNAWEFFLTSSSLFSLLI